ncbi:MAG: hypothetical protein RL479_2102, partial [Verrucomicrobiota bacterium]
MSRRCHLRILAFCVGLFATRLPAAEFHVAPHGSDDAPGTAAAPFATVQRAQAAAAPGDTVFLRGGTYRLQEGDIAR